MAAKVGGTGPTQPATAEVQELVDKVRLTVEERSGRTFAEFTAVEYRTQVVAGTNFFVKVCVGSEEYVHLRIFRSLSQEVELSAFQLGKRQEDKLEYF